MSLSLFALSVDAVADENSRLQRGERRSLLVLVKAGSREEALSICMIALAESRWTDAQLHDVAILSAQPSFIEDRNIREAGLHAAQNGHAIVVF